MVNLRNRHLIDSVMSLHSIGPQVSNSPGNSFIVLTSNFSETNNEFTIMVEQGLFQPSKSPCAKPLHLVAKKDFPFQLCETYRKVKAINVTDPFLVLNILDFVSYLHSKAIFPTIDLVR
ncbi:hypothetical protein LAZ67_11003762 [Cordylochernes scorpioides]|uniref:Uncharacterized protein n=1 Tax=Cordylochernes scorpioides TaxID=51811 RepID=A0ABY6L4Z8_9ARAC|nr:hypothetical protein LAZ67_11003762 [Cordylochernes scorpioides]